MCHVTTILKPECEHEWMTIRKTIDEGIVLEYKWCKKCGAE